MQASVERGGRRCPVAASPSSRIRGSRAAECLAAVGSATAARRTPACCRTRLTDNGAPMTAGEVEQVLHRLRIVHATTFACAPNQNGRMEVLWSSVEGRLMAMLDGVEALALDKLNDMTIAWVERDYHRRVHREIATTPLNRPLDSDHAKPCPDSDTPSGRRSASP